MKVKNSIRLSAFADGLVLILGNPMERNREMLMVLMEKLKKMVY